MLLKRGIIRDTWVTDTLKLSLYLRVGRVIRVIRAVRIVRAVRHLLLITLMLLRKGVGVIRVVMVIRGC